MELTQFLKGKKVKYMTDARVEVILEIDSAKEEFHSEELEPSTPANDWYPAMRSWTVLVVTFTTGFKKSYNSFKDINVIEDEK